MNVSLVQKILTKLVSFDVLGGQSNLSIANYIEAYLSDHGIQVKHVPNETGEKRSLHCRIGPATDGGMVLSGHMDVVPVEGQLWDTDPFVLTEKSDNKWYGRGSCDMKGFIACVLAMLPEMQKAPLKKPIYFAFSYDEEIGCLAGPALAADIMDHYPEKPKYAIIGEPSNMLPVVGQKGIAKFKTTVNGSAGHSSRIKSEISAISEAARLILWLESKMQMLIDANEIDDRFEPNHSSIHVGIFEQSGIATNVISDHACFKWDVRVIPKNTAHQIKQDFEDYCTLHVQECRKVFPDFEIKTEADFGAVPALDTPENKSIVPIIKKLTSIDNLSTVSYAAEAGQFSEAGFETVICGPGDIAQAHRANEFIKISQVEKCLVFLKDLIKELS